MEATGPKQIHIRNETRVVEIVPLATTMMVAPNTNKTGQFDLGGKEIPAGVYRLEIVERLTLIRSHVDPVSE